MNCQAGGWNAAGPFSPHGTLPGGWP